jgi:predicted metalloprotease with PDZ domain
MSRVATAGTIKALLLTVLLLPIGTGAATLQVERDGRVMELRVADDTSAAQLEEVERWARHIADSLAAVYGHWPRARWRMSVYPIGGSDTGESRAGADVIPWAQVNRANIDTASFYILADATADELIDNWTGYHELAHLLVPYRGWGDMWFSEGLASYYQNILRARTGVLSEREAWQKLYEGFERGRADSVLNGQSLADVSRNLRRNGAYMRVYWSGAWYFLAADLELRKASGGRESLDSALARLNACCADDEMSVSEMVRTLDRENNTGLFQRLYSLSRGSTRMPEYAALFDDLGLRVVDGTVELSYSGASARLRSGIMAAP